jgi:hypothetical protein
MRQWKDDIKANLTEIIKVIKKGFLLWIHMDEDMALYTTFVETVGNKFPYSSEFRILNKRPN